MLFEIDCTIALEDVSEIRRLVERIHLRLGSTQTDAARIAMATHELLENAIKFSIDGTARLRIDVTDTAEVRIQTRNRATADHREDLATLAAKLAAADDPMTFYVGLMARAPNARGGLGLGRVAAEGDMSIGFVFHDDVVEVHASSAGAEAR
jgi:anti-sigma regulatory factor (Ser/Thr protein kinase)